MLADPFPCWRVCWVLPWARVDQRRETPAVSHDPLGDSGKLVGRDEVLPGLHEEERGIGQADRDIRGVLVEECQVLGQAVAWQVIRQADGLSQQGGEGRRPFPLGERVGLVFGNGEDAARVEQDVHQPSAAVQTAPHPVPGPPRTLVESGKVVELHATQFGH